MLAGIEEDNSGVRSHLPAVQVAPNPVRNQATLSYELPRTGRVQCAVYDAAGNRVAEILNAYQPAGIHSVRWNAAAAQPGLYFLKLLTDTGAQTARLVKVD